MDTNMDQRVTGPTDNISWQGAKYVYGVLHVSDKDCNYGCYYDYYRVSAYNTPKVNWWTGMTKFPNINKAFALRERICAAMKNPRNNARERIAEYKRQQQQLIDVLKGMLESMCATWTKAEIRADNNNRCIVIERNTEINKINKQDLITWKKGINVDIDSTVYISLCAKVHPLAARIVKLQDKIDWLNGDNDVLQRRFWIVQTTINRLTETLLATVFLDEQGNYVLRDDKTWVKLTIAGETSYYMYDYNGNGGKRFVNYKQVDMPFSRLIEVSDGE